MRPAPSDIGFGAALISGAASVLLAMLISAPASAHGQRTGPLPPGIPIPSLTHGQMAVIADYRPAILDLASRQAATDETFRRLLNFGNIQYTSCLWGVMPGSLTDEDSPFNECSHAYLAATKAVLAYMQTMPGSREAADSLASEIDADMVRKGSAWVLCQFSGEAFSTGEVIAPRWRDVFFHPASLMTLVMAAMIAAAAVLGIVGPPRRPDPPPAPAPPGRITA